MRLGYLLPLLLAACDTAPPEVIYRPVPVDTPLQVDCHAPQVAVPDWPLAHLPAHAPFEQSLRAMLAEVDRRKAYEAQLVAALAACR